MNITLTLLTFYLQEAIEDARTQHTSEHCGLCYMLKCHCCGMPIIPFICTRISLTSECDSCGAIMWYGNQIASIHGKLLFSPGCLKQGYTCTSVHGWSQKDQWQRWMCRQWSHAGNNCSWSAVEASRSIHEASWPTLSLYEQPGFHTVLETAQTKLCCPPLVQTMCCLSSRNVHVTWEQGYTFGHLLLSVSEHHSTTAHSGPPCSN